MNGDTLLYSIPDFGAVNFYNDFRFLVQTDTLAQLNDQVCFNVLVTPVAGDNNPANNYYSHCFTVVNSYDPNDKQVSPTGLTDTSLYDLTYTIRFQNTGNAPAQHVYVLDTLDQNIDESTFQLLAYSHEPQIQIIGKRVRFNFPNINLPDSVNNEPMSHGYVQYRVRRNESLPIGTQIQNTAYIYFDFNPPVQTNTTLNEIGVTSGVGIGEYQNPILFSIFPNPIASGHMLNIYFNSSEKKKAELSVYDLSGRKLFAQYVNASEQSQTVSLPSISPGVYLVELNDGKYQAQQKLVVLKSYN
ncbi:MAG: T9SS type A sorting domain-containing protein [Bacteroidetes bacterium]|nr:T9SS type A sorting domain-containing protein [Bacteroidota bacterium]